MKAKTEEHKKPILIGAIILGILVIAGIGGLFYWLNSLKYVYTDDAAVDGSHVSVSAKILGRVSSLTVDEGAKVKAGDVLVQLDDTDLRAQQTQATALLNSAKQNLILAKVNVDKAQEDFERTKTMLDTGVTTKEQYDHAAKTLDAAKAQYAIAQTQIDTAKAQLGVIETQLLNTRITAPFSGVVAKRSIMPGEVVQPGQVIFLINDLHHVWVTANFEETKIRLIHPNQAAEISVDAYPNHPFKGRVAQVGSAIVPPPFQISDSTKTTQKLPVKILFDRISESMPLVPGMSVEVKIKVNQ
ncbi:MAG: HlyD family secretion protein [Bacillota bacterium]